MIDIPFLSDLFFSTEIYGVFGPLGFITVGLIVGKRNKELGLVWALITFAMTRFYLTPDFALHLWQFLILVLGGILELWNLAD